MSSKFTIARLTVDGERFEVMVHPDRALEYKMGKKIELSQVIAVDEIFTDASKGLRAPHEKLQRCFHTSNILQVADMILKRGELLLTSEQRRKLIEEKKRQIVPLIARNFVDPRTGLAHPPTRIEQALSEAKVSIDPFKDAEEQTKMIVEQLRAILPLKSEKVRLLVKVPPQFAPQAFGVLRGYGKAEKEEWGPDGSLTVIVEIPAGVHSSLIEKLASITKGTAQASVVR